MKQLFTKINLSRFTFTFAILAGSLSQAEPFKEAMGVMGKSMKAIVKDFKGSTVGQPTLDAAIQLNQGCQSALAHIPPDFSKEEEFVGPVRQVCEKSKLLILSLQQANISQAQTLVNEMLQLKDTSHDKYRQ